MEMITTVLICSVIGNVMQGIALCIMSRLIYIMIGHMSGHELCRRERASEGKTRIISPYKDNDNEKRS